MKYVLIDAQHIDYYNIGLEVKKEIKKFKTSNVTKYYKDGMYNATIVYSESMFH